MGDFASKGVAGAGLGTGIAGLALGVLNSGAGLLGNGWGNGWNGGWGRNGNGWGGNCGYGCGGFGAYGDIGVSEALAQRDSQIAFLSSKVYSDESDLAVYKYFDGKIKELNDKLCEQAVFNATATGTMKVFADQIGALQTLTNSITRTAVPESAICDFSGRSGCNCATSTV